MISMQHSPQTSKAFNQLLEQALDQPCVLCGGLSSIAGVFVPDDSTSWGASDGKQRHIFYGICSECLASDHAQGRVEGVLALKMELTTVQ